MDGFHEDDRYGGVSREEDGDVHFRNPASKTDLGLVFYTSD